MFTVSANPFPVFTSVLNRDVAIIFRKDDILKSWEELLELVAARRARLEKVMRLQKVFQEMINAVDWMDDIKVQLSIQSHIYRVTFHIRSPE